MNVNDVHAMARDKGQCYRCQRAAVLHGRETAGGIAGLWWCTWCRAAAFGGNSFQRLTEEQRATVPRIEADKSPCCVCGKIAVLENHHLAPRKQFGDEADEWPQVRVCHECHRRWEDRMGTHSRRIA